MNLWDPIGVYSFEQSDEEETWPPDEYDCLRDHIVSWLAAGLTPEELRTRIDADLAHHFGLIGAAVPESVVRALQATTKAGF